VKKAELKAGVAYYATSQNNGMETYHDSLFKTHTQHSRNRFYVIFDEDGQPKTGYRSASVVYMTNCPTYGHDCLRHKKEDSTGINCYRTDFRLMDIRDEYWSVIKRMHNARKARPTKDIRAERLRRIAKRQQESQDAPIRAEFYSVLSQITGGYVSSYDRVGGFNIEEMAKITKALKASMPAVMAVAS
jgi:hypothetical protein